MNLKIRIHVCISILYTAFGIAALVLSAMKAFDPGLFSTFSIYYPIMSNPYIQKQMVTNSSFIIGIITEQHGEINQDLIAFVYFAVFTVVLFLRASILFCPSVSRCCKPSKWPNPRTESSDLDPLLPSDITPRYSSADVSSIETESNYLEEHIIGYFNIFRPFYRPILIVLFCIYCGVVESFLISRLIILTFALELLILFIERTIMVTLFYCLVIGAVWGLFIFASLRFPNKTLVVACIFGLCDSIFHAITSNSEHGGCKKSCGYFKYLDPLVELVSHGVLLSVVIIGNFY